MLDTIKAMVVSSLSSGPGGPAKSQSLRNRIQFGPASPVTLAVPTAVNRQSPIANCYLLLFGHLRRLMMPRLGFTPLSDGAIDAVHPGRLRGSHFYSISVLSTPRWCPGKDSPAHTTIVRNMYNAPKLVLCIVTWGTQPNTIKPSSSCGT